MKKLFLVKHPFFSRVERNQYNSCLAQTVETERFEVKVKNIACE